MKLYFMKQVALDHIKSNMTSLYVNYYREKTNQWIYDLFDYDPFELFIDLPDFQLTPMSDKKGKVDLENCKILYNKLINISESQASDERLWAGLCHSTFYQYVRVRWNYPNLNFKTPEKDAGVLLSRCFFSGGTRSGFFRNTLAKYWWVGHATYQLQSTNKFELLDALGPDDFTTKVTDLFYSNTFTSNPTITKGICKAWQLFSDRGIKLNVREYFRPALQYMNALGGGILLDVLSEDEIKDVFFDYVYQLYSKETPNAMVIKVDSDDIEDLDDELEAFEVTEEIQKMRDENNQPHEKPIELQKKSDTPHITIIGEINTDGSKDADKLKKLLGQPEKVTYGCTVVVLRKNYNKQICYGIPKNNTEGQWYTIQKRLLNKQVGESVRIRKDTYIVESIEW